MEAKLPRAPWSTPLGRAVAGRSNPAPEDWWARGGQWMAEIRSERLFGTQAEAAVELGVSVSTLRRWERVIDKVWGPVE